MFKVELFVEDKKLAGALRSLQGVAIGQPSSIPVANATVRNGQVTAEGGHTLLDLFGTFCKKTKKAELNGADLRDFLTEHNRSQSSKTYLAQQAIDAGLIKRRGKGVDTTYPIVR